MMISFDSADVLSIYFSLLYVAYHGLYTIELKLL